MTVFEYMIIESYTGVERDLAEKVILNLKSELDLIPICNCDVTRKAFLTLYKLYPKIETLEEEEKNELKRFVIKNFPGRSKEELVENCRIIYTISMLTKK